jgi:hypothetical protein
MIKTMLQWPSVYLLLALIVALVVQWRLASPEIVALTLDPTQWGWETIVGLHLVAIAGLVAAWRETRQS